MGKRARVFTLLVCGAKPNDIPSPFSEMQLRPLNAGEVEKLIAAIENTTGTIRSPVSVNALLRGVRDAENSLPNIRLELEPYIGANPPGLHFRLWYEGYEPVILQTITVGIPFSTKDPPWSPLELAGRLEVERRLVEGVDYIFKHYSAGGGASKPFSWRKRF